MPQDVLADLVVHIQRTGPQMVKLCALLASIETGRARILAATNKGQAPHIVAGIAMQELGHIYEAKMAYDLALGDGE